MANFILASRGDSPPLTVGKSWTGRFVKRTPEVQICFSRRYDYQRAKCEDPAIIAPWFDVVSNAIIEHGIHENDIYNVDKTGFTVGHGGEGRFITDSEIKNRRKSISSGNRSYVTVIECISDTRHLLQPFIIFKGKQLGRSWFDALEDNWRLGVSLNAWTFNDIAVAWLKKVFIPQTSVTKGTKRLLILDGHGSYLTVEFDKVCTDNNIVPIYMPPHSSHLLQPLDVGCFGPLKHYYQELVTDKDAQEVLAHTKVRVSKEEFLKMYRCARSDALSFENIVSSFAAAGIVPLKPEVVLSKLDVSVDKDAPPRTPERDTKVATAPKAPTVYKRIQNMKMKIDSFIEDDLRLSDATVKQLMQKLLSIAESAHLSDLISCKRMNEMIATYQAEKEERQNTRKRITNKADLSREEYSELYQPVEKARKDLTTDLHEIRDGHSKSPKKKKRKCTACGHSGHNILTCKVLSD